MNLKILILSLILLAELILESTVFHFVNIGGIYPDLVLITITAFSIIYGRKYSYIFGLIIGLLADILFGQVIGVHAISYILCAYIIGSLSSNIIKENILTAILFYPLSVIIYHLSYYFILYLLRVDTTGYGNILNILYWIVNFIFILIIYPLILKLANCEKLKPQ